MNLFALASYAAPRPETGRCELVSVWDKGRAARRNQWLASVAMEGCEDADRLKKLHYCGHTDQTGRCVWKRLTWDGLSRLPLAFAQDAGAILNEPSSVLSCALGRHRLGRYSDDRVSRDSGPPTLPSPFVGWSLPMVGKARPIT